MFDSSLQKQICQQLITRAWHSSLDGNVMDCKTQECTKNWQNIRGVNLANKVNLTQFNLNKICV